MGLNKDINKRKKGLSNLGKCGKGKKSPEGVDVDNCGIVDLHWEDKSRR